MISIAIQPTQVNFQKEKKVALIKFQQLSIYVSLCRSRIYALIAAGEFPKPVKIGKSSRWIQSEVDFWLENRVRDRDRLSYQ